PPTSAPTEPLTSTPRQPFPCVGAREAWTALLPAAAAGRPELVVRPEPAARPELVLPPGPAERLELVERLAAAERVDPPDRLAAADRAGFFSVLLLVVAICLPRFAVLLCYPRTWDR